MGVAVGEDSGTLETDLSSLLFSNKESLKGFEQGGPGVARVVLSWVNLAVQTGSQQGRSGRRVSLFRTSDGEAGLRV